MYTVKSYLRDRIRIFRYPSGAGTLEIQFGLGFFSYDWEGR